MDYDRQLSFVAVNDKQEIVGVVRVERPPPNHLHRDAAFIRMIVSDDFQKLGLGSAFMDKLNEVRAIGCHMEHFQCSQSKI